MMDRLRAVALAAALAVGVTAIPTPAPAQVAQPSRAVPTVLWAATGAVLGAVAWPLVFPATVPGGVAGVPAAAATVWSWNSFVTTRAAVGAVVGGLFGYTMAP